MKILIMIVLSIIASNSVAKDIVLVIPKDPSEMLSSDIQKNIIYLAATVVEPGDRLTLFSVSKNDALIITEDNIPKSSRFNEKKQIFKYLSQRFFPVVGKQLKNSSANTDTIALPIILQRLSLFPTAEVYIFGSPFLASPMNLSNGYPNDGHIVSSLRFSEFGTDTLAKSKSNTVLHWLFPQNLAFVRDYHRTMLTRFFQLYSQEMGFKLCHFSSDIKSLVDGCMEPPVKPLDKSSTKLEFNIVKPLLYVDGVSDDGAWLTTNSIQTQAPRITSGKFEFGITWNCGCDLDLYAAKTGGLEEVSFQNPETSFGYLIKDLLTNPNLNAVTKGYETIVLKQSLDLSKIVLWVNLYKNDSQNNEPIKFTVRARFNGAVYSADYQLEKSKGNGGNSPRLTPYWQKIDLTRLFKLKN